MLEIFLQKRNVTVIFHKLEISSKVYARITPQNVLLRTLSKIQLYECQFGNFLQGFCFLQGLINILTKCLPEISSELLFHGFIYCFRITLEINLKTLLLNLSWILSEIASWIHFDFMKYSKNSIQAVFHGL